MLCDVECRETYVFTGGVGAGGYSIKSPTRGTLRPKV